MKPADSTPSGAGQRGWVYAKFYGENVEELEKKIAEYMRDYHPFGYDTHVTRPPFRRDDGYWEAHVKRWSSCD